METTQKQNSTRPHIGVFALPAIAVIALLVFSVLPLQTDDQSGELIRFNNWIDVEVKHPSCFDYPTNPNCGLAPDSQRAKNTVTNLGLNFTRNTLSGLVEYNSSLTNWTVIQLSTDGGAPAATDSTCPSAVTGNGLDIAQATTVIAQNTGNYTASITFSVSGTQNTIQKVCLHNGTATGGPLMASALISSTNVASGDTLIVNYSVAAE